MAALFLQLFFLFFGSCVCYESEEFIVAPAGLAEAPYPEWAHYHWVWLSNDRANQSSMLQYAKDYLDHDIPVGAVDIDSGWSTGYNNFIFNPEKYPDPDDMIQTFHSLNISVLLWATSMINTDSSNFQDAHDNGYLLKNGLDRDAIISWWHGNGGLLDYSYPKAVEWWHQQLDNVLDYDIDGWKCDGTDPYVLEIIGSHGKGGYVSRKDYSDAYYSDFFDYTRKKLGKSRLIMSRPVDALGDVLYLDYSPRRVVLAGWVGDQDPTFKGLENALKRYLKSAWADYPNFGSDIGGYRNGDGALGRTKELFIRWAQLGAFSPLMENGGNGEHRPWAFDNETLSIYKKFVAIHYKMAAYLLSFGTTALETNTSTIIPLAPHQSFIDKFEDDFFPPTYNYLLGYILLVAPIISHPPEVTIDFPNVGDGPAKWKYYFNDSLVYSTGDKVTITDTPLNEYPVFVATNKILPLKTTKGGQVQGRAGEREAGGWDIKWSLYLSKGGREDGDSFKLREMHGSGMIAIYRWVNSSCIIFNVTAHQSLYSYIEIKSMDYEFEDIMEMLVGKGGEQFYHALSKNPKYTAARQGADGFYTVNKNEGDVAHVIAYPHRKNQKLGHSILIFLR